MHAVWWSVSTGRQRAAVAGHTMLGGAVSVLLMSMHTGFLGRCVSIARRTQTCCVLFVVKFICDNAYCNNIGWRIEQRRAPPSSQMADEATTCRGSQLGTTYTAARQCTFAFHVFAFCDLSCTRLHCLTSIHARRYDIWAECTTSPRHRIECLEHPWLRLRSGK